MLHGRARLAKGKKLTRAELEREAERARRVASAYEGTPLAASYERKAQIAEMKLELAESSEQSCPRAVSPAGGVVRT